MIKKILQFSVLVFVLFLAGNVFACVGRTLYIGALESNEDKVMSEMLSLLINERTGTTVQIRFFPNQDALYTALKSNVEEERADILIEDTIDAMARLNKPANQFPDKDFVMAKDLYEKEFGIIWLNPFGFNNSKGKTGQSITAPLVRRDVLTNFPLLPRVLNKLAGAITNKVYTKLLSAVDSGEKPKNAAKDFLRKRKFI